MMTKHYCKKCFRAVVDPTAHDKFLLMSKDLKKCPSCGRLARLVCEYFKYGEHVVTDDGLHFDVPVKHIGIDLTKSYWKEPETDGEESNNTLHTEGE